MPSRDWTRRSFGDLTVLRHPRGVYDKDGRFLFMIPHDDDPDAPRVTRMAGQFLEALTILGRENTAATWTIWSHGFRSRWARREGKDGVSIKLRLYKPPIRYRLTYVVLDGRRRKVTADEMDKTFHEVGGVPRLVQEAKLNPQQFAEMCDEVFGRF